MVKPLNILETARVASPCPEPWSRMHGDERVRFCTRCMLHVYNLSEMTQTRAEALILEKEGRLCAAYYQRPDGTSMTRDCPVGLRAVRRKVLRAAAGVAAVFVAMIQTVALLASPSPRRSIALRQAEPTASLTRRIWPKPTVTVSPPVRGQMVVGRLAAP